MNYLLLKRRSEPAALKKQAASSEEQQGKINEVRELLGDLPTEMPGFLTDATIRRFLRATNWSAVQATKSLKQAAKWRRQYEPEKIRWEDIADSEHQAKRAYIPDYLDKKGRPVFVSLPTIKSKSSEKEHIKYLVYNLENLVFISEGAEEENVAWICDLRGWTLSSTPFSLTRESLYIVQNYYPGLIAVAIVTNAPRIFESFWKMVSHFLEPKMNEKVKFVCTNNPVSQMIMADMFDLDKLDSAFGGYNTASIDISMYGQRMREQDQKRAVQTRDDIGKTASSS